VLGKTQLLTMDWERRIWPAVAYLQAACGFASADILRSHAHTRSLDSVLKPRVEALLGMGVELRISKAGEGRARGRVKGRTGCPSTSPLSCA